LKQNDEVSQKGISEFYEQMISFLASHQKNGLLERAQIDVMENILDQWHNKCSALHHSGPSALALTLEQKIQY